MYFTLALTPILFILVLMVGFRWGAARAGGAGYISAFLIAVLFFGAGPELLAYAQMKALLLTLDVLLVIWAAFLLFRVADEAGAINTIGQSLPHLTPDKGMQALIIGWVFASFLQGVGGFGVPVAVIAPIMVGLGFAPLAAVVIPSIGHGWAVTFGSMGSSFNAMLAATGLPEDMLAFTAAVFLGVACLAVGLMVAHAEGGFQTVRRLLIPVLILGTVMGSVQLIVVTYGPWNIGAFTAGLAGMLVGLPIAYRYKTADRTNSLRDTSPVVSGNQSAREIEYTEGSSLSERFDWRELMVALSAYVLLILITLGARLIPAVNNGINKIRLELYFPEITTSTGYVTPAGPGRSLSVFGHAGMILFYSAVLAFVVYSLAGRYKPGAARDILDGTLRRVISSSVSIAAMVSMAVIMQHSGMTETLARGLAQGVGMLYPIVAPWIGGLGAFMTGSNTNSNVVFSALQKRTAEILGFSLAVILGAQTAGAALASVMAPTKVVVGASTAGMADKEGDVMRKLVVYTIILLLLISGMAILGVLITT
jgi:lactate permease